MATLSRLFCYGTLCFPAVMRAVTGRVLPACQARLFDYACYQLHGELYPAIVPQKGTQVSGLLYTQLTRRELRLIDSYEGEQYLRQRLEVMDADSQLHQAWGYVLKPTCYQRIKMKHWSAELFAKNRPGKYIRQAGYR